MKIYVNGDSFVYGDELSDRNTEAWPNRLGCLMGATTVNDSALGGSNSRTVYHTIRNLSNDFDLYVIVWTSDSKFTFYKSDDNTETNFSPPLIDYRFGDQDYFKIWGRTLYQTWYNRLWGFKLWLQQIMQLQSMLVQHNKNYIMLNSHDNHLGRWTADRDNFIDQVKRMINMDVMNDQQIFAEYEEIQYYVSQIDQSSFYGWGTFTLRDLKNQFDIGPRGHLLADGHQHIANLLYHHICSK